MRIPEGFVAVSAVGARGFARPEAEGRIREALVRWGSLARAGAHAPGSLRLAGRGPVHAIPLDGGGRWVIRRYRRGGWMAPLLGDRYLRRGAPRPLVETQASEAARRRGIATPRIVAGVSYAAGLLYRADLVSEWIPGTGDLAAGLFPIDAPRASLAAAPTRRLALAAAGAMVVRLAAAGIRHRDLNAKNLLVRPDEAGGAPELWVLDLDRATVHEPGSVPSAGMGARLARSLRKFERHTGHALDLEEWQAFSRALAGEPPGSGGAS